MTLPGSVAPFTAVSAPLGTVPAATKLTIQFWLAPQGAAAARYAAPCPPRAAPFRHFLSPSSYIARFGPTRSAAASVESWLRSKGFTRVGTDLGRDYVQATAPVSTIEAALRVRLNYYRARNLASAGRYPLRANDRPSRCPCRSRATCSASPAWTTRRRRRRTPRRGCPGAGRRGPG